jgi:hypothetical protein
MDGTASRLEGRPPRFGLLLLAATLLVLLLMGLSLWLASAGRP